MRFPFNSFQADGAADLVHGDGGGGIGAFGAFFQHVLDITGIREQFLAAFPAALALPKRRAA